MRVGWAATKCLLDRVRLGSGSSPAPWLVCFRPASYSTVADHGRPALRPRALPAPLRTSSEQTFKADGIRFFSLNARSGRISRVTYSLYFGKKKNSRLQRQKVKFTRVKRLYILNVFARRMCILYVTNVPVNIFSFKYIIVWTQLHFLCPETKFVRTFSFQTNDLIELLITPVLDRRASRLLAVVLFDFTKFVHGHWRYYMV